MSLILGSVVRRWLLVEVAQKWNLQKKGSEITSLIFGKFEIWGTPKQSSLTFSPVM